MLSGIGLMLDLRSYQAEEQVASTPQSIMVRLRSHGGGSGFPLGQERISSFFFADHETAGRHRHDLNQADVVVLVCLRVLRDDRSHAGVVLFLKDILGGVHQTSRQVRVLLGQCIQVSHVEHL